MEIVNANDIAFEKLLKDSGKIVVKFYAGWCGSCRLIAPKFKQLAENDTYSEVSFVEIDAEHNPIARSAANVNNLPFFATFNNGKLVEGFPTSKIEAVETMIKNL